MTVALMTVGTVALMTVGTVALMTVGTVAMWCSRRLINPLEENIQEVANIIVACLVWKATRCLGMRSVWGKPTIGIATTMASVAGPT